MSAKTDAERLSEAKRLIRVALKLNRIETDHGPLGTQHKEHIESCPGCRWLLDARKWLVEAMGDV